MEHGLMKGNLNATFQHVMWNMVLLTSNDLIGTCFIKLPCQATHS